MAKQIKYGVFVPDATQITAPDQQYGGQKVYTGTDVAVDAEWALIESGGVNTLGEVVSAAYLYEDGVVTDSYIISPNYNHAALVAEVVDGDASPVTGLVTGIASPITVYTATLTPCSNTTTPTNILSVTIPANDWADGEMITVDVIITGTVNIATLTLDLTYGSDSYTDISSSSAYTEPNRKRIELWRDGSDIYIANRNAASSTVASPTPFTQADGGQYSADGTILTPVTFNTEKDLVITATFDTADAGDSVEILAAKVVKM